MGADPLLFDCHHRLFIKICPTSQSTGTPTSCPCLRPVIYSVRCEMNLPTIPGFQPINESNTKCGLVMDPQLTFVSAMNLLEWLPEDWELQFYDRYYPSMSDPGAYVSIRKKFGVYSYRLGNHGWSSDTLKQSPQLLAAWLLLNSETQDNTRPYHLCISKLDPCQ